jgi:8-oxo-dGTP diphosphatase
MRAEEAQDLPLTLSPFPGSSLFELPFIHHFKGCPIWEIAVDQKRPWVAADAVVFDDRGQVLLIQRKNPPFQGAFALPGGFVEYGETTEAAALRELREETGIEGASPRLVGVYSDPARDPRHHVITIAYLVQAQSFAVRAGDDAAAAQFVANWDRQPLAFDHRKVIADALLVRAALDKGGAPER